MRKYANRRAAGLGFVWTGWRWPARLVLVAAIGSAVIGLALFALTGASARTASARTTMRTASSTEMRPSSVAPTPVVAPFRGDLSLQPWADQMRRRLGARFTAPGREVTTLSGTLTVGSGNHSVVMVRRQLDQGEQVDMTVDGTGYSWNAGQGGYSGRSAVSSNDRPMIERVVLDSPDQFVLAQLRGASYYTVATDVRPSEAGSSPTYAGPLWNVVRIGEPSNMGAGYPLSHWRVFYINTSTGLIDKVLSNEGDTIQAQISGWSQQAGETIPTHITWTRNNTVVMDLALHSAGFGPRQ